ncbi:HAMP domain-containing histidine kinase [Dactylosporangium vinaceum]|uniref:histidine kinase n=1 Tax=Dactylosporangium vinaceum TaxID=53362 RepID=A0ABV5MJT3_9ACTN|nr:HAMP domain-containing sensor histidine kinase [Dactylosporangium vinaceum]UAB92690.1 HAMP domain-containing histidine kinase [Dactylosporangium vinaceum]
MNRPAPPPRPRLRTRLAFLHAGLAFGCGVLLLAFVDLPLISAGQTARVPGGGDLTGGQPAGPAAGGRATGNLAEVLRYSVIALVLIAAVAIVLGWAIAGRALRPLQVITAAARSMSADNLNGRLRVPAAYREFGELADTLEGLIHRLRGSFSAQRQFIANASHELRTPLTVQRTLLQLTLADPDAGTGALRAACRDVLDLGQQQERLINALLTLAGGYQPIERWERFDLAELVRTAVLEHRAEAERREVEVRTALGPAVVTGDPRLAVILVTNLIDNAVRHNHPRGIIDVATTAPGRLTVANSGGVIPPAEIGRLFEPFQRLGTDRTDQTEGHGLGLAIVAAVAEAHHAPLSARSRPEGGLELTIDFPPAHPATPGCAADDRRR